MDGIRNCYGRRLVAVSPILQEYDASTVELAMNPAEFENLAAKHNLVEIVEACRREANYTQKMFHSV